MVSRLRKEKAMSKPKRKHRNREKPATSDDIRAIAGPLDDDIIVAIQRLGATRAEVSQAFDWLQESRYTLSVFMKPLDERVRRVYEILDYAGNGFTKAHTWD